MIRRKKQTIFTDCKDTTTVLELKKMIQGIIKLKPENMRLLKDNLVMDDSATLQDYKLTSSTAKAQSPAIISLTIKTDDDDFEGVEMTPYSCPPDLPEVMKTQENAQDATA